MTNISEIVNLIELHRERAYRKINEELVLMYYEIGSYLSNKIKENKWGSKIIEIIANQIQTQYPELQGFNKRGLYRMVQFYETYKDNQIVSPLVSQISWTNNVIIFSHESSIAEKEFYIKLCIKNNYSKRELERQIKSHYYERYLLTENNLDSNLMKTEEADYPNTKILDNYSLEFLKLPKKYSEKQLQKSIVDNMKDFILEIGKDFSFIGKEYRININGNDYFIDLLFYNRAFSCLVAFELKIGQFHPEYISKMDFYLEALDQQIKKKTENPSIGIILCSNKNETIVRYSSSRSTSPTKVSTYSTEIIDLNLLKNKLEQIKKL